MDQIVDWFLSSGLNVRCTQKSNSLFSGPIATSIYSTFIKLMLDLGPDEANLVVCFFDNLMLEPVGKGESKQYFSF